LASEDEGQLRGSVRMGASGRYAVTHFAPEKGRKVIGQLLARASDGRQPVLVVASPDAGGVAHVSQRRADFVPFAGQNIAIGCGQGLQRLRTARR
jgi:hypothetical protein